MEASSSPAYVSVDSSRTASSSSTEMGEDHAIDESKTLFLGDLPSSTTAQQIFGLFPEIEVSHVEIKIINSEKGSFCYAFVTFATAECAQLGVDKYRNSRATFPDGTIVSVGWAKRNSRLHVSNLDENTTEKDLIDLFSRFGVLSPYDGVLVIKKPSSNPQMYNQTVCYGVIHFEQRDSAENARNDLNNTYFGGRRLRVEWNRGTRKFIGTRHSDDDLPSESCNQSVAPVISIYVQFETINSEARVNELLIKDLFEPFNNMTGCFIKTNNTSVSGLRQHGYAFVHFSNSFEGTNSALAAASISKDGPYEFKGALLHAEVSKNFRKATLFGKKYSNSGYQYKNVNDEVHNYGRNFDSFEYGGFSDKHKFNDFIDPQIGPGSDGGAYFYAQPTMPQFMMPCSNSMAYPLHYQSPFIESYSPTSTNSDFIDSQILYYPAPYPYNVPPNMRALPHGIIPMPVQAVQNHAPYGMKNLNGNIDNDSNNDNDDDETRHTLRFYPQSLALLPQPPPPSRPHPGQAFHQSQIHDSQMMIQMPSNVQLIQNSQALLSKVTTLPQSPYQVRVPSPFQQQQEILLQQPQMQHHHHHQQQGQQQQQSQMQQRLFGSPW